MKLKSLLTLLCIAFLSQAYATEVIYKNFPNNGDVPVANYSTTHDPEIGKKFFMQVQASGALLNDPIVADYVENLGNRLANATKAKKQKFHFFVIDDPEINAFTGPGGYVGVLTGLMLNVKTQGELAAVMAHEIGHVIQHHYDRELEREKSMRIPQMAAIAAAIALGAANPQAGSGAASAAIAGFASNSLKYSRENEMEADHVGIQTLYDAGFDPNNMPNLFMRFQKIEDLYPADIPAFLQTHPMTNQRLADTENLSATYQKKTYNTDQTYNFIRARLRVETNQNLFSLTQYFKNKLQNNPNDLAYSYGYALTLSRLHNKTKAMNLMTSALQKDPNNIYLQIGIAEIQDDANEIHAATETLKNIYQRNPNYYPVMLLYADEAISDKQTVLAENLLEQQVKKYSNKKSLYYLLAKAQAKNGKELQSKETLAKYFELLNYYTGAIQQLNMALNTSGISASDKKRIQGKIKSIKAEMDS